MGWTSQVKFHVRAPVKVIGRLRKRFTHKGFQNLYANFRNNPSYDTALTEFAAYERKSSDPRGTGELVYEFSVWKDNVYEVAQRFLQLIERTLVDELGKAWRHAPGLLTGRQGGALSVSAWSELGHGEDMHFNLRKALVDAHGDSKLLWDERQHQGLLSDVFMGPLFGDCEPDFDVMECKLDLSQFQEFTAELAGRHAECEPDAFRCDNGGRGAKVRLLGLQKRPELNGRLAIIADPVDLETQRWPVQLITESDKPCKPDQAEAKGMVSVRRCNLELVNLHIPEDSSPIVLFGRQASCARHSPADGGPFLGGSAAAFCAGLRGSFLDGAGTGARAPTSPATANPSTPPRKPVAAEFDAPWSEPRRPEKKHATAGLATCCFWLQGSCRFGKRCHFGHVRAASGECHFGARCKLGHGSRGMPPPLQEYESMFGFGDEGMMGFTAEECDELLMQGIKPWDPEAEAALSVLYGDEF